MCARARKRRLTDLVSLLRYTMVYETDENATLEPYREIIERASPPGWTSKSRRRGQPFDEEQRAWLEHMRDIIASSLTIEREDFNYRPFATNGWLG